MKHKYSGNIKSLSSLIDRINNRQSYRFFPTNEITHAKLKNDKFEINGMLCKGIGKFDEQKDFLSIDLKVRLKRPFTLSGLFVLILFSGFIWGENVTINGESDPTLWKRIEFVSIGLALFSIPTLILLRLRNNFERKVKDLIK
jgi:hypothetical protein|tara:strand:- start:45 stop:473 length:429 start_codon:yes stop_codon:yes gene_type:complete